VAVIAPPVVWNLLVIDQGWDRVSTCGPRPVKAQGKSRTIGAEGDEILEKVARRVGKAQHAIPPGGEHRYAS
jgi:hypothetical protein